MRGQRGFTMIELLVVLAVLAVLATLVAPSFNDQMAQRRLEGVSTELSTDLQFARTQAVDDRAPVRVITSNGGARYVIRNAVNVVKAVDLPAGITVTDAVTITYDQLRGTSNAQQILVQSAQTPAQLRVDTNVMGRVSVCAPNPILKGYPPC